MNTLKALKAYPDASEEALRRALFAGGVGAGERMTITDSSMSDMACQFTSAISSDLRAGHKVGSIVEAAEAHLRNR